jgi:spore coat polysaccharide biosynthesis protein SpsF
MNERTKDFHPREPSVVAIIQARMGSSRLPGKVLRDIGGNPMLFHVVLRARHAQSIGQVIVATTTAPEDDPVTVFCQKRGFPCYRGDPVDVLDRYYQAAKAYRAETVVRLTGDCPIIDPSEIDRTVSAFFRSGVDFAANRLPPPWERTTPIGMDTEVVSFEALEKAWQFATADYEREHVMPYFYEKDGRFNIKLVDHTPDLGHLRLTVDTSEDLQLIRLIVEHFGATNDFSLTEVVDFLENHPELLQINALVDHKAFIDVDERTMGRSQ